MFIKTLFLALLPSFVLGHMEILNPCPRYSSKCKTQPALPPGQAIDYNLKSPIGSYPEILLPLCHHTVPWPTPTETWVPGQQVTIPFNPTGGATHSGGHCEFSLSYDGGKTYVVVHQELRYCFYSKPPTSSNNQGHVRSYTFTLPKDLPGTDHAVFAWSWVNAMGNREFYMNCGDIYIKGKAGSYSGKQMTIANYGPDHPEIPEFLGNYDTGIDLYTTNITHVTVTGNGYGGGTGHQPSTTEVSTSSTPPATTSNIPTTSDMPPPESTTNGGQCTAANNGAYMCKDSGDSADYMVCSNGQWALGSCDGGTVCKQSGSSIYCGYA